MIPFAYQDARTQSSNGILVTRFKNPWLHIHILLKKKKKDKRYGHKITIKQITSWVHAWLGPFSF